MNHFDPHKYFIDFNKYYYYFFLLIKEYNLDFDYLMVNLDMSFRNPFDCSSFKINKFECNQVYNFLKEIKLYQKKNITKFSQQIFNQVYKTINSSCIKFK